MIKHVCSLLCAVIQEVLSALVMVGTSIRSRGESSPIAENEKQFIFKTLINAQLECDRLDLKEAANRVAVLEMRLKQDCSLGAAHIELQNLNTAIMVGLTERKFAFIRPGLDAYFEKDKLFGEDVYEKFEFARQDVKEAGNCLSAELYTAAVFHLMRVSEHGLRRLAKKLKVTLTHKGKYQPVEYAEWDKTITAIKNKISGIRSFNPGPRRQAQLEFYSDAADHCTFMKDVWRNNVSHTHKPYIEPEALSVFNRVRDFMVFLGKQL